MIEESAAAHSLPDVVRALAQDLYDDFCRGTKQSLGKRVHAVDVISAEPPEVLLSVQFGSPLIVAGKDAAELLKSWAAVGQRKGSDSE